MGNLTVVNVQLELQQLEALSAKYLKVLEFFDNGLAFLCERILGSSDGKERYGFTVYYSINTAEGKFAIIRNLIIKTFKEAGFAEEVHKGLEKFSNSAANMRRVRNKIAHGSAGIIHIYGKPYARILGPIFEFDPPRKKRIPVPGMSLSELEEIIKKIPILISYAQFLGDSVLYFRHSWCSEADLEDLFRAWRKHQTEMPDEVFQPDFPPRRPPPPPYQG